MCSYCRSETTTLIIQFLLAVSTERCKDLSCVYYENLSENLEMYKCDFNAMYFEICRSGEIGSGCCVVEKWWKLEHFVERMVHWQIGTEGLSLLFSLWP